MPRTVTLLDVATAALAAYHAGTLAATAGATRCLYSYPEDPRWRCAIGAALTESELRAAIEAGVNCYYVLALADKGIIALPEEERVDITLIQRAHDAALCGAPVTDRPVYDAARDSDLPPPKHPAIAAWYRQHDKMRITAEDLRALFEGVVRLQP